MNKFDDVKKEIEVLVSQGNDMYCCFKNYIQSDDVLDIKDFMSNYEIWYTKSLLLVKQILPQRLDDFEKCYKNEKRKQLMAETYTISDALRLLSDRTNNYSIKNAAMLLLQQIEIVRSCNLVFDSVICNIQSMLQADIFDSELDEAKHLLKKGFLRAAGAVCGVVIEKHFAGMCTNRNIDIAKKNPTIADYNDKLKDVAYDTIEWRRIQRLGDLRNLCDHNKDREPTKDEVEELISGTERIIKTIF